MHSNQISKLRDRLGLNQVLFAQLFGVHPMTVSKWERGELQPNEYQSTLMESFRLAARNIETKNKISGILIGAGITAALLFLLSKAK